MAKQSDSQGRNCRLSVQNPLKNQYLNIFEECLEYQTGKFLWGKDVVTMRYEDIRQVIVHKGLNPLSSGTITIIGGGGTAIKMNSVRPSHCDMAVEIIEELREKHRNAGRLAANTSIPEQIRALAELKDAGILTTDEFETKKRDLLERM